MTRLSRLSNASSGKREDNIFAVFSYLQSDRDFAPMELFAAAMVTPRTMLSYLYEIAAYQMEVLGFVQRLEVPVEEQWYYLVSSDSERDTVVKVYDRLRKKLTDFSSSDTQKLIFEGNVKTVNKCYYKLELALLIVSEMIRNENRKGGGSHEI